MNIQPTSLLFADKAEFSTNDLELIENELEDAIKTVMDKVGMDDQMAWSKTILQKKALRIGLEIELANEELSMLQNMADKMHFALYNQCQVVHKHMPPLDLYQNMSDYVVSVNHDDSKVCLVLTEPS